MNPLGRREAQAVQGRINAAAARLAGVAGASAERKDATGREAVYLAQTGRRDLTAAQRRRLRKKGRL